ncbi:unnamed protein product [Rotaria sordida]|uniref:Flavin-containing monooxygenase n=1 Tax=Rotaria sordida TaxID=392033 RepID=A0A818JMF4_9BILA|nr:unnamed protein product [Rotaria sordida]
MKRKLVLTKDDRDDEYYAVIIGAGFSGIGIGIKLHEAGMYKYVKLERLSHIGGTWYANQYPGCACDIPSNLYSFSFEPNSQWSYFYGRQQEIAEYMEHCADKYDLRRHIEFNTTVIRCDWLDERQVWRVTTRLKNDQEKQFFCRILISGNGPLSNGAYPTNIPGIDKFQGRMCHTAEWDKSIDFINKRVAAVGTGSSGVQVVPELYKMNVSKLYVFQRTPAWVIPRIDRPIHAWEKRLFIMFPIIQKFIRGIIYWIYESTALSFTYRLPIRHICQELVNYNLTRQVKDKELRKELTPSFDVGCKRILISNDWYPTLQKPNVLLVTSRIREVTSNSIITQDGNEYPVDIIVWSTGFQVHKIPFEIFGSNSFSLSKLWAETIQAYRGMTMPNFPNLFLILGPNVSFGYNTTIFMIEAQLNYIMEALLFMQESGVSSISIKKNVFEQYNQQLQSKLKNTVWQLGSCRSYYQDAHGNNIGNWPDFTWIYYLFMRNFDHKNYQITKM